MEQRERGGRLEERRAEPLDERRILVDEAHDRLFVNGHAVHGDALAKIHEMRRRVARDAQPLRAQQRVRGGHGASLSVRAGDVQHRIREVRLPQLGEQGSRALQTKLERASRSREEIVERRRVAGQGDVHPVADGLPLMCRNSWLRVRLRSLRCTTWSSMPWSSRNSAV